jgi:hypothetical protein
VFFGGQNNFRRFILGRRKLWHKLPKIDGSSKIKLFLVVSFKLSCRTCMGHRKLPLVSVVVSDWATESFWGAENRKNFLFPRPAGPTLTHSSLSLRSRACPSCHRHPCPALPARARHHLRLEQDCRRQSRLSTPRKP